MENITIQTLTAALAPELMALQAAYSARYPEAPIIPSEVYFSPAFEQGRNVFCALAADGRLIGYAPLYPVLAQAGSDQAHTLWTEIKVHPEASNTTEIKDLLFERILARSRELTGAFPEQPSHLTFQYFPSEAASSAYVVARGGKHTESVFTMQRDLAKPIAAPETLPGLVLRPWRMESVAEQQAYVEARNECFPEAPVELADWQYFMLSPQWAAGTTFAAFDGHVLVGNVAVFWDEAENQKTGQKIGFTEYIFVRSAWRGRKIARSLILAGLGFLKQYGLSEAHLEVRVKNENALRLYQELGYEVLRESRLYVIGIPLKT